MAAGVGLFGLVSCQSTLSRRRIKGNSSLVRFLRVKDYELFFSAKKTQAKKASTK